MSYSWKASSPPRTLDAAMESMRFLKCAMPFMSVLLKAVSSSLCAHIKLQCGGSAWMSLLPAL